MKRTQFSKTERIDIAHACMHGVPTSSADDDPLIGRTKPMEQLLGWLKYNHREPGTGRRHGCYLVTGVRGVGKTAYVNRVLFHYRKWLLWLYGDELNQFDELHLNLGAGSLSAMDVLRLLAEGIYRKTKTHYLLPIFRSQFLWYLTLLLLSFISYGAVLALESGRSEDAVASVTASSQETQNDSGKKPSTGRSSGAGIEISDESRGKMYFEKIRQAAKGYSNAARGLSMEALSPASSNTSNTFVLGVFDNAVLGYGAGVQVLRSFDLWPTNTCRIMGKYEQVGVRQSPPVKWVDVFAPGLIILFFLITMVPLVRIFQRPLIRRNEGRFAEQLARLIVFSVLLLFLANAESRLNLHPASAWLFFATVAFYGVMLALNWSVGFRESDPHRMAGHAVNDFAGYMAIALLGNYLFRDLIEQSLYQWAWIILIVLAFVAFLFTLWKHIRLLTRGKCPGPQMLHMTIGAYIGRTILHGALIFSVWVAWSLGYFHKHSSSHYIVLICVFLTALLAYAFATALPVRWRWVDFGRGHSLNFRYLMDYIKVLVVLLGMGGYTSILIGKAGDGSIFNGLLMIISYTILDTATWLELLFPLVVLAGISDAFIAGHALREPDFFKANQKPRTDNQRYGRRRLMELAGQSTKQLFLHGLERFFRHIAYQRRLRQVYRRLRNPADRQVGLPSMIPFMPAFSFRWQQLPYTYQTLESDVIDLCEMYNQAYPFRDLIVVCDELDKISLKEPEKQAEKRGDKVSPPSLRPPQIDAVRALLSELKNVLHSAEARFIFVAGREIHDHWLMDTAEKVNVVSGAFATPIDLPSLLTDQADSVDTAVDALTTSLVLRKVLSPKEQEACWNEYKNFVQAKRKEYQGCLPTLQNIGRFIEKREGPGDPLMLIRSHYMEYPSIYAGSVALLMRELNAMPSDRMDYDRVLAAMRSTWMLRDLIAYLTIRGEGLPSAIILHLDRFIEQGDEKRSFQLVFDRRTLPYLQLASFILTVLRPDLARATSQHNDKVVMSAMHFATFVCRFAPTAFDWSMAEELRDVVSPYHDPNTREVLKDVFARLDNTYLEPIKNGVYSHRFREWLRGEMAYASALSTHEAAAYSFGMEQGDEIRGYIRQHIRYLVEGPAEPRQNGDTTRALHSLYFTLGALYEVEESYDQAIINFKLALRELKRVSGMQRLPDRTYPLDSMTFYWGVLHIRDRLRIGHVNEQTGNLVQASAFYHAALDFSLWIIREVTAICESDAHSEHQRALRDFLPRLVTHSVIWQPFMCIAYVTMKQEQVCASPDRMRAICDLCNQLDRLIRLLDFDERAIPLEESDQSSMRHVVEELWAAKADALSRLGDAFLVAGGDLGGKALEYYSGALDSLSNSSAGTNPSVSVSRLRAGVYSNMGDARFSRLMERMPKGNGNKLKQVLFYRIKRWFEGIASLDFSKLGQYNDEEFKSWTPVPAARKHPVLEMWFTSVTEALKTHHWRRASFQLLKIIHATQRVMVACEQSLAMQYGDHAARRLEVMLKAIERWTFNYMGEAGEIAGRNDEVLERIIVNVLETHKRQMLVDNSRALTLFRFRPPEAREAELRYLSCLVTHYAYLTTNIVDDRSVTVSWEECCRRIKQQVKYYEYCAFPVRLRALCLELAGDMEGIEAQRNRGSAIAKDNMIKGMLRAYEYYRLALDIREGFGVSFTNTSFSIALLRDKAANVLNSMEKQLASGALSADDFTTLLSFISRGHESPLTESQCHEVRSRVQYRYAAEAYRRSVSIRTMGREFWFHYRKLSYLTDDVHGEEVHFSLACERMMINYSCRRMDGIRSSGVLMAV